MLYKPPDRAIVTVKPVTNQLGNKIAEQGKVLLPDLLRVFSLEIKPVTEGNEIMAVLRRLNKFIRVCAVLHFLSIFVKGSLSKNRYFCYCRCMYMYAKGKIGNKRGNKTGNAFYFVTSGSTLTGVWGCASA